MTGVSPNAPNDLAPVREAVARVGARIQPLLEPHPGLARRNAFAHIWLGVKLRFGDDWKETAEPTSLLEFIEWIDSHPNDDYEEWPGPPRYVGTPRTHVGATTGRSRRAMPAEPTGLFDGPA